MSGSALSVCGGREVVGVENDRETFAKDTSGVKHSGAGLESQEMSRDSGSMTVVDAERRRVITGKSRVFYPRSDVNVCARTVTEVIPTHWPQRWP